MPDTISTLSAIEIITSGGCVVDIGQISAKTRFVLRQRVQRGLYEQFTYYGFPIPKQAYCLAGRAAQCMGMAP